MKPPENASGGPRKEAATSMNPPKDSCSGDVCQSGGEQQRIQRKQTKGCRDVSAAQPAGYKAYFDTAHMDEGGKNGSNFRDYAGRKKAAAEAVEGLLSGAAAPPPAALPDIENAEAFCLEDEREPEPPPIIEGFLAPGDLFLLSGASKSYKSWLAIQTALCVGSGVPWLGRQVRRGGVLIVNFELKKASIRRRLKAIAKRLGCSMAGVSVWNLRNVELDEGFLAVLNTRIAEGGYELIILDPLYALHGLIEGENGENSNTAISKLLSRVRSNCEKAGAACMVVHHYAKGDSTSKASIDRAAGAGAFGRFPDNISTISAHQEQGAYVLESDLRDFAPVDPFAVRREGFIMVLADELDPSKVRKPGRSQEHSPSDLLAVLKPPMTSGEWKSAATTKGISERTFYRLKQQLEQSGEVAVDGKLWRKKP